jgi:hypothetical protein
MKPKAQNLDEFSERIIFGVRKAVRKMIEERAAIDEVVMVGDGEEGFKYVPARELLETLRMAESEQMQKPVDN